MDLAALFSSVDWPRAGRMVAPAFAGAIIALGMQSVWRRWRGRRQRRLSELAGASETIAGRDADSAGAGLREFAREVEGRLDAKLDRLELLLNQSSAILEGLEARGRGSLISEGRPEPGPRGESVSPDDRDHVLALAAMGKKPEEIAEEVGLLRGEVDLILRLHRREGKVSQQ